MEGLVGIASPAYKPLYSARMAEKRIVLTLSESKTQMPPSERDDLQVLICKLRIAGSPGGEKISPKYLTEVHRYPPS